MLYAPCPPDAVPATYTAAHAWIGANGEHTLQVPLVPLCVIVSLLTDG
jgi:hypothetical protein